MRPETSHTAAAATRSVHAMETMRIPDDMRDAHLQDMKGTTRVRMSSTNGGAMTPSSSGMLTQISAVWPG